MHVDLSRTLDLSEEHRTGAPSDDELADSPFLLCTRHVMEIETAGVVTATFGAPPNSLVLADPRLLSPLRIWKDHSLL
jgi:hypothetical protein